MREVCGTVSAMAMLAGFRYPADPQDKESRTRNYGMVQKMAGLFKEKHGSIICRELLAEKAAKQTDPTPSDRTPQYYSTRPCGRLVEESARIAARMLKGELES